ncbi:type II toxin-antitoxin system VapB family antitoxin [Kitasatospora sp. NPDC018619]|uniref:type II toxin-antitoxin system VapB family antitoxin n=1 Tax=unclassified Kitasatospora TaxID=2633591 RepID=UPI00379A68A2
MAKTMIDLDEEALALAAEVLGTTTKKDTVNAALAEVGARRRRELALQELLRLAEDGAFDKALETGFKGEVRRGKQGGAQWELGKAS